MELLTPPIATSVLVPVSTKTADYTAAIADAVVLANAAITITLPSPAGEGAGRQYNVKNIHASATVTIAAAAGTIDGGTTVSLSPKESVMVVSDGSNWWLI